MRMGVDIMSSCSFIQMSPDVVIAAAEETIKRIDVSIAEERKKILAKEKRSFWYRVRRNKPSDEDLAKELGRNIREAYSLVGSHCGLQRWTCNKMISLAKVAKTVGTMVHMSADDWDDIR